MTSERDLMREEFEAAMRAEGYEHEWFERCDVQPGNYASDEMQHLWEGWQAARRAKHSTAEPVAYLVPRSAFRCSPHGQDAESHEWLEVTEDTSEKDAFPVFAAPQQAPLTDEQVRAVVKEAGFDCPRATYAEQAAFISGLRHGEAAHGIGAAKETSNG